MKLDILAFGAHPDDVEMSCGGTIAKHIALGKTIGIADLTKGELGTRGTSEIRAKEAEEAAKILGVRVREQLNLRDGFVTNDEASQLRVIKAIRKYQPEIVLANAIGDRHPDHRKASELVKDAAFLSGLLHIETQDNNVIQKPWRPKHVYHYIQDTFLNPSFVIDITDYIDIKMNAIGAFKSQFYNPKSKEPETILTSPEFFDGLKARSREFGRKIGVVYGEGLISSRNVGAASLFDLM
jgi:N-acetylglucosamine malate deacetylase 1